MNFFRTFLACLVAIIVSSFVTTFFAIFTFVGILGAMMSMEQDVVVVKPNSVLHLDFSQQIIDHTAGGIFDNIDLSSFTVKGALTGLDAVNAIDAAANDPNIKGIYLDFPLTANISTSTLYELREALGRFRESEKFIISYADVYSQGGYWLASLSDKVYMNPEGGLDWSGLAAQTPFFKGTMDKLGVTPEIFRHGRYKSAIEPFIREDMSDENRLQTKAMLTSMWGVIVEDVAKSRNIEVAQLQKYADELTLLTPSLALANKAVDTLAYRDQVVRNLAVITESGDEPTLISLSKYARTVTQSTLSNNKVAVLYASGDIVDVSSGEGEIVGNKLADEIAKLRKDKDVKAVVLRVNSPGGSVLASDIIHHQMKLLKAEKPVVVSMGDYAASGGYYISAPADEIIAAPTTLTGSIGVFALMFDVQKGLKNHLGVNFESVTTNASSDMGNMFRSMTSAERIFMQNNVDSTYVNFVGLVADGRAMKYAAVDSIASGRVWSGVEAKQNGLVDRLGTLQDAINVAADKAGLTDYRVNTYPSAGSKFEAFFESMNAKVQQFMSSDNGLEGQARQAVKMLESRQGIQARMPYDITLEN